MSSTPQHDAQRKNRRRAFSLAELLVVIAIIAILAAMLFPAIKTVRGSAESTRCRSNLGQIGLSMLLYANDNEGWIPPNSSYGNMGSVAGGVYWSNAYDYFNAYISDSNKLNGGMACPTHIPNLKKFQPNQAFRWPAWSYAPIYPKYHWNAQPIAPIPNPSLTIYMAEKNGDLSGSHESVYTVYATAPIEQSSGQSMSMQGIIPGNSCPPGDTIRISHRGRFQILCLDGHAELVAPQDTVATPCTSSGNVKPNRWTAQY